MGMMSKHYIPFEDFSGFFKSKKRDKVVVYSKDFPIDNYKEVNYYYIFDRPEIKIKNMFHANLLVSHFDGEYFKLPGRKNRKVRWARNTYNKIITIKNDIEDIEEVIKLIDKWDEFSGGKYGWIRHSGYDRSFFLKYYEQEKENLFSLFFYHNDVLIGYSVISNIVDNHCFTYVARKMDISFGTDIGIYIDFKTFENLYSIYGREYKINWGASKGSLLKYKKKFPVFYEGKVWFYKVKKE